ncbi:helix-turn-helix domain-containing protein [Alphaproteobacteria bacterium HT1-32]|nr:helix-turn-helix domain-containing protein [Alphaproteobacteria bacterium HT1-32]
MKNKKSAEKVVAETGRGRIRGRTASGKPNPVDVHVGGRLRERRTLLGMSQTSLADSIGLTFQQVQKYESGANRMGASRLFEMATVLDTDISYFFEGMSDDVAASSPRQIMDRETDPEVEETRNPMLRRETLELVRAFYKFPTTEMREQFTNLTQLLSAEEKALKAAKTKRKSKAAKA